MYIFRFLPCYANHALCLAVAATVLFAIAGCGGGGGGAPATPPAVLKANVKVLPSDGSLNITALTADSVTMTGTVPAIAAGDILFSSKDSGFIRKAKTVTQTGGTTTVTTEQGTLEDVFQEAQISLNRYVDPSEIKNIRSLLPGLTIGTSRAAGAKSRLLDRSLTLDFEQSELVYQGSKIIVDGSCSLKLGIDTDFQFRDGRVRHVLFRPYIDGDVAVSFDAASKISMTGGVTFPLGSFDVGPVRIPTGIFLMDLVIEPRLKLFAKLKADMQGNAKLTITGGLRLEAGVEYSDGEGWKPVGNAIPKLGVAIDRAEAQVNVESTVLGLEGSVMVQGIAGPYVTASLPAITGLLRAQAEPYGGVFSSNVVFRADGGFKVEILSRRLADVTFPNLYYKEFPLEAKFIPGQSLTGRIAFVNGGDIWVMEADGSGKRQLTTSSYTDSDPNMSWDRQKVVFFSNRSNGGDIYEVDVNGGPERRITQGGVLFNARPTYSPNRQYIAFDSGQDSGEIYIIRADGTGLTRVTNSSANDRRPTWSPSGDRLVWHRTSADYEGGRIWTVAVANGVPQGSPGPLLSDGRSRFAPTYSPNGNYIVYQTGGFSGDLYIMNSIDDPADRRLTTDGGYRDPSFSPGGLYVTFSRNTQLGMAPAMGGGFIRWLNQAGYYMTWK